jgi:hypothetical protein
MAYNHEKDFTEYYPKTMTITWVLLSEAFTSTDQEVAEHLIKTHFPVCQPIYMILFTRFMGHWLGKSLPWAERAFDNTSFESMDDAVRNHGVCSTINRWIDFMLRSRSVFVNIRGVRLHMHMVVQYGCPQG